MEYIHRSFTTVSAVVLALALGVMPAAAEGSAPRFYSSGGTQIDAAPPPIAGYDVDTDYAKVARGVSHFTVPALTCPPSGDQGIAVGLGVENVIGAPTSLADVYLTCSEGVPHYQLDALANGVAATDSTNVAAGDSIRVTYMVIHRSLLLTVDDYSTETQVRAVGPVAKDHNITFGSFPIFVDGAPLDTPDFRVFRAKQIKVNNFKPFPDSLTLADGNPHILVKPIRYSRNDANFPLAYI